jgi:hypothetical protein
MGLLPDRSWISVSARAVVCRVRRSVSHALVVGASLLALSCHPIFIDRVPQGPLGLPEGTIRLARASWFSPQTRVNTFDLSTGRQASHEFPGEDGMEYRISEYGTEGKQEEDRLLFGSVPAPMVRRLSRCGFQRQGCISTDVEVFTNEFSFSPTAEFVVYRGTLYRPDGSFGEFGIYLKPVASGENRPANAAGKKLPGDGSAHRMEFSWSHDGKTLCYLSAGNLWLMEVPSGRGLSRFAGSLGRLSPNGRYLAYVAPDGRLVLLERASGAVREVYSGAEVVSLSGWSATSEMVLFAVAKRPWPLSTSPTSAIVFDLTDGRSYVVADLPAYGAAFRWIVDPFVR